MSTNNRKRLLGLIEILIKYSDEDHHLTMSEILDKLDAEYELKDINRKTIYEDFAALNKFDLYDISFDQGYYLQDCPFSLSEVKIILDALHSLRNLDEHFLKEIKEKLYSFLSIYDREFLEELNFVVPSDDKKLLYKLETILNAIRHKHSLIVTYYGKEKEVVPLFLMRKNDYYYLHVEFPGYTKSTYEYRLDRISNVNDSEKIVEPFFNKEQLFKKIKASTDAFHSGQERSVLLTIVEDEVRNIQRIKDEFPNAIINKNTAYIKVSVNDVFFSRITSFKNQVEITEPQEVVTQYQDFLKDILNHYTSKEG